MGLLGWLGSASRGCGNRASGLQGLRVLASVNPGLHCFGSEDARPAGGRGVGSYEELQGSGLNRPWGRADGSRFLILVEKSSKKLALSTSCSTYTDADSEDMNADKAMEPLSLCRYGRYVLLLLLLLRSLVCTLAGTARIPAAGSSDTACSRM